jgi:hypothetical protein
MNTRRTHCKYGHELTPENVYQVYKSNGTKNGRRCRLCAKTKERKDYKAAKAREYYATNPDKYVEAQRRYRQKIRKPKEIVEKTKCRRGHAWIDENIYSYISKQNHLIKECKICAAEKYQRRKDQLRENHLQRKYGLDQEAYEKMLLEQNGRCFICPTSIPGGMGQFAVDHCHKTGKIRKLLCFNCNTALGLLGDDPNLLERMAAYIRSYQ